MLSAARYLAPFWRWVGSADNLTFDRIGTLTLDPQVGVQVGPDPRLLRSHLAL